MGAHVIAASAVVLVVCAASVARAAFPVEVSMLMDTSVDPCDDFYQYSCGAWIQNHTFDADHQAYAYSFNSINERNERLIHDIIKEDWPLVGELYDSCMVLDALSEKSNAPLQKELDRIHSVTSKTALARVAAELGPLGSWLFTRLSVAPHPNATSTNVLYVGDAARVLPDPRFYSNAAVFAKTEPAFRSYITALMELAGVKYSDISTKSVEDVVITVDQAFAATVATDAEGSAYTPLTYKDAAARYPLGFQAVVEGLHLLEKSALTVDSIVVVRSLAFMDRIETLWNALALVDLKIYYSFLYVHAHVLYWDDAFVQTSFDFFGTALQGHATRPTRETMCAGVPMTFFPELIGKYFFLKLFDGEREENVRLLVHAIEHAMADHIATLTWLDEATREEAATKLAKLTDRIGRSTETLSYAFVLTRHDYFSNVQTIKQDAWAREVAKINQPIDRSEWVMSAASANAYYSPWANKIVLPAGILQPPFYSGAAHPVQNFGAIGAVIGHELTHGFDPSGRHYDGDGNEREWWTDATAMEFEARATCLKQQYSAMRVYGDSGHFVGFVNGNLTVAENIADNGGVRLAFDAYHDWVQRGATFAANGVQDHEVDQLFFVSFAQIWCGQIRDGAQLQLLASDAHAPKPARVNGVAMNSEQFARTFQCKVGSNMNPENKCQLW